MGLHETAEIVDPGSIPPQQIPAHDAHAALSPIKET
jgi:hypothetical protein